MSHFEVSLRLVYINYRKAQLSIIKFYFVDAEENKKPTETGGRLNSVGAFIWDLVKILIIALIIIIPFRRYVAEPFVVSGSSMLPNFHNHDYLIVDRFSYIAGNPQRGDVIVLLYPKDVSQFFIKRIIGLPGETVCFNKYCNTDGQPDGHVYIVNAQHPEAWQLSESYLPSNTETSSSPAPVHLASGQYFVLGDNRTGSSDSRVWGILPSDDIVGKVWVKIYPFSDFGAFHTPSY